MLFIQDCRVCKQAVLHPIIISLYALIVFKSLSLSLFLSLSLSLSLSPSPTPLFFSFVETF